MTHHPMQYLKTFAIPLTAFTAIILGLLCQYAFDLPTMSKAIYLTAIVIGSFNLIKDTYESLKQKNFALDYIALLAISTGVISGNFLVALIIILMLTGGEALEDYSLEKAKSSLTSLADRIPNQVLLQNADGSTITVPIQNIQIDQQIIVRSGEVIPLDGFLMSTQASIDESSLTGEAIPVTKISGDIIRSGTVNLSSGITIQVTKSENESTYHKIVELVQTAQSQKAPLIRLADRYSVVFTIVTIIISGAAYIFSNFDLHRALAVLVIATPCPLILATPIALMGGMSSAARRRIIFKRLASIEQLARVDALIFDKTGTITMGQPQVTKITPIDQNIDLPLALSITNMLEKNSLHPLAKALVNYTQKQPDLPGIHLTNIHEEIGTGITGIYEKNSYSLTKAQQQTGMNIALSKNGQEILIFHLEDIVKKDSVSFFNKLIKHGIHLAIFTGDKQANAQKLMQELDLHQVQLQAECSPEDKQSGIKVLHQKGKVVAMVGDGINDAPALATADIGMVFAHDENTAATQAADVIMLGSQLHQVQDAINISQGTIHIALQSILAGIAISIIGMIIASTGHIPPIMGAFIQELIDIAVILNALRASRL